MFYTFTWAGTRARRENEEGARKPRRPAKGEGRKDGDRPKGKGPRPKREDAAPRAFTSRPERKDRIDPDNPFAAALMGLRKD